MSYTTATFIFPHRSLNAVEPSPTIVIDKSMLLSVNNKSFVCHYRELFNFLTFQGDNLKKFILVSKTVVEIATNLLTQNL